MIWVASITGITAYYWLALFSVYNDMPEAVIASETKESKPPKMSV